jgi:hypothetical protein
LRRIDWAHEVAWFFGGAFFINALPHLVAGVMGEPHKTPLALMRGCGVSSATVNVLWAAPSSRSPAISERA